MTLKLWAVRPGELRRLERGPRLIWAARCALRVEAWRPPGLDATWEAGLRTLVAAAFAEPGAVAVAALARALGDQGAVACNRRDGTPEEARGRCMNYAASTLRGALEATALADGPALAKAVIDVAKAAGSIPAVLAHAGETHAPKGADAVEFAARALWDCMRTDLAACRSIVAPTTVADVRALAPLWPSGARAWLRS